MSRLLALFAILVSYAVLAQGDDVTMRPNRGQWDSRIDYTVGLQSGNMYLEQGGFTYFFYKFDGHDHDSEITENEISGFCVKSRFLEANTACQKIESKKLPYYRNYFLGSNKNNWKSEIHDVQEVIYKEKYQGIDLQVTTINNQAKYSWIVLPGSDFSQIKWQYDGAKDVQHLKTGELKVVHEFGDILEGKPIAWKLVNGNKVPVKISYTEKNGVFSFDLVGQISSTDTVVIDPSLTFSTFTGSLADNWGFTAAPDPAGNLYAGGIVFGSSYPVTTGAVSQTFSGGTATDGAPSTSPLFVGFDMGISKFNSTGTAFIFSTYVGGSANETPHSIVSDAQGNMYMLGVTSSPNFPVLATCYDPSFNGGPTIAPDNLKFTGSDIVVFELNPTGTAFLASTFVGGTGTDGISMGTLQYNYGDNFRGEIIVDNNFVYFSSVTSSPDFPIVLGSQPALAGGQDAVVVKMTKNLTTIVWSTFYGGTGDETGNGIQLSPNGSLYVAGGTSSSTIPLGATGWDMTYNNGRDGYLTRFNMLTGVVMNGTFIGTGDYDQAYFVQVDDENSVYVFGQSAGDWAITPGCYGNPSAGQFLMKLTPDLTTQLWVTTVGAGIGNIEISPTAFLVSNCKDIYISGWGGNVNFQNSQATTSTTNGFPVTSDAFQSNTNGSNFWIAVLDENAASLKYATFIGGTTSSFNHVDGGTSRFDKNGNIYHAVCGACGGNNFGFTTTPGVIGPQNLSVNCNLAAFKFELSTIEAVVAAPQPLICMPDPVVFNNNSANGNAFHWYFGDGAESNEINPSHAYSGPGQYEVTLVVTDTNQCYAPDTVVFEVNIGDFQGGVVNPQVQSCSGSPAQLEAYGGATYLWSPAQFLNNANIANPVATVTSNTTFSCIVSDSCGVDTVQVQVIVSGGNIQVSNDTTICIGQSVHLFVNGIGNVEWSPSTYLDSPTSSTPVSTPQNSIQYTVSGETVDGCPLTETVNITVVFNPPVPVMADTLSYCNGTSGTITVSGADTYTWSPNTTISSTSGPTVTISSPTEQYYYCDFTNACATLRDSVFIDLIELTITAGNDTIVCPGEPVEFFATGALSYFWSPNVTPIAPNYSQVATSSLVSRTYTVIGQDQYGCLATDSVRLDVFPYPQVNAGSDVYAFMGDEVQLNATTANPGTLVWSPAEFLSCVVCTSPVANPDQNFTYTVTFTDENGCTASDQVTLHYDPIIYVPNAFTPDGNSINADFFAVASNVRDFKMEIFNRWGELIYTGDADDKSWDGNYKNLKCPDGVYIWKISYRSLWSEAQHTLVGHVSLLR